MATRDENRQEKIERDRIKAERKKLEAEKKKQKKEAKKRAKEIAAQEAELAEEEEGGGFFTFLATVAIIAVWLGIVCLIIKLDVGGFGSGVLTPLLKDVPVVNKILPDETTGNVTEESTEEVVDLAGNKRMYTFEILRTRRLLNKPMVIFALIILLGSGVRLLLLRRDMKAI